LKISNVDIYELGEKSLSGGATWASTGIGLKLTTSHGLVGYGEAVPTLRVLPVIESLKEVARVYTGKDPLNTEANLAEWRKHDFYLPMSFDSTTALSAFDIACWDIIGKEYGAPIYKLIGGETRDRVRMYANGWYDNCVTPEDFGSRAKKCVKAGYTGLKFDVFGAYYDWIDEAGIKVAKDRIRAVKEAASEGVDLLIEHHGRFNPNSAIMAGKAIEEEFDPLFMEEPVHPEQNWDGLRKYRNAVRLKVALGERLLSTTEVAFVASNHLADFLQIDLTNFQGVTGARKGAAIAEAYGVEMAFHNAFGPIQNAATIQIDAAIPNFLIQESFYDFFPLWKRDLVFDGTRVESGYTKVPDKPGLGVDINEKILESHRVEGQEYFNPNEPVWVVRGTWKNL
jgi:L-alanine-DL-glutamate epimerase-like enolase superfamily enzyme